jgi:sugar lactone lactonase YvrE
MTMEITTDRMETSRDMLGEGALWDSASQVLYWVDAMGELVRRLDPATGVVTDWKMPAHVGSVALTSSKERLLVALRDGIYLLSLADGGLEAIARPADLPAGARFNDGKVDRQGRFVVGTILADPWTRVEGQKAAGKLYRLNLDRTLEVLDDDIRLSNATCFSPDGSLLYFADTPDSEVRVYDYDGASGKVSNCRRFVDTKALGSVPDGATIDAHGCLWVALPQIAAVAQYDAEGRLLRTVSTPCPLPTCPTFGGPALDQLYVTSLHDSGNGRLVSNHPDSGFVFRISGLNTRGLPEVPYAG